MDLCPKATTVSECEKVEWKKAEQRESGRVLVVYFLCIIHLLGPRSMKMSFALWKDEDEKTGMPLEMLRD